jgi:hypothetical protein
MTISREHRPLEGRSRSIGVAPTTLGIHFGDLVSHNQFQVDLITGYDLLFLAPQPPKLND